jgi:hypothetical protein
MSGNAQQCVWYGEEAAAAACTSWELCEGFWCGAATDVPASNASWCWARGAADVIHGGPFQDATSFIKKSLPQAVELKCTSQGCNWVWATGQWNRGTGEISVTFDNGTVSTGTVDVNCSTLTWVGTGATWRNEMLRVKKVHVVYMAHFDVG